LRRWRSFGGEINEIVRRGGVRRIGFY